MESVKVSIIVPVYKVEKYIKKSISSIINQSYCNMEIIVVDDGSPDKSIEVTEEILKTSGRTYRILKQNNRGVASARNAGITGANGEWIIAIDSDDIVDISMISEMVRCIDEHLETKCVFCDFQVVKENEEIKKIQLKHDYKMYASSEAFELFFKRKAKFISPALLVNKRFLLENNIHYDEGCLFAEDDLYVWKILACSEFVVHIREPLYYYVRHEGSTMTSSGSEKFMTGYAAAKSVDERYIKCSKSAGSYSNLFLTRHVFGLLHAAAKVLDYKSFSDLAIKMNAAKLFQNAKIPNETVAPVLMKLFLINKQICYQIMKAF